MSIPIIDQTQSVLSYRQWQQNSFQPSASNFPTSWAISPAAPPGMSFNTTTGLLNGALSQTGIFNFQLTATNASGSSTPVVFTMAGYYAPAPMDSIVPTLAVDMATRVISVSYDGSLPTLPITAPTASSTPTPLLSFKYGDDAVLKVVFYTQGVGGVVNQQDVTLDGLAFAIKDVDSDVPILSKQTDWSKVTYVQNGLQYSYHLIYLSLNDPTLQNILLNLQVDTGTFFIGEGELQWIVRANLAVGPTDLTASSSTIPVQVTLNVA